MADPSCSTGRGSRGQGPVLPADIIDLILAYTDDRTARHSLLVSCKAYYDVAVAHLYSDVTISTSRHLRAFTATVARARDDVASASHVRHTRRLSYCMGRGSSTLTMHNNPELHKRLYLSLMDVSGCTSALGDSAPLFTNLRYAAFDPLPPLTPEERQHLQREVATSTEPRHPILSSVRAVELRHSPHVNYDKPPDFHLLGMGGVEHLTVYHVFGAEISNNVDLQDYLGVQPFLATIDFRLEEHTAWAMGSNAIDVVSSHLHTELSPAQQQPPNPFLAQTGGERSLDVDWYIYEYTAALSYTIFKLAYFRKASAAPSSAPPVAPSLPALRTITIHLGEKGDAIIDEIAERTKEKIAEYKKNYIDALQAPMLAEDGEADLARILAGSSKFTPTKVIVRQRGARAWVLDGEALPPSEWRSFNLLWQEVD